MAVKHISTLGNVHIASGTWVAHQFHFKWLCGFKLLAFHQHGSHLATSACFGSCAVVQVVVDGHLVLVGSRFFVGVHIDAAQSGFLAIWSLNRTTEEERIHIHRALGVNHKVFEGSRIVACTVNHAIDHGRADWGTHLRHTTVGRTRSHEEVGIYAHKIAFASLRLALRHARNGFVAGNLVGSAHATEFQIRVGQVHCGIEHTQRITIGWISKPKRCGGGARTHLIVKQRINCKCSSLERPGVGSHGRNACRGR